MLRALSASCRIIWQWSNDIVADANCHFTPMQNGHINSNVNVMLANRSAVSHIHTAKSCQMPNARDFPLPEIQNKFNYLFFWNYIGKFRGLGHLSFDDDVSIFRTVGHFIKIVGELAGAFATSQLKWEEKIVDQRYHTSTFRYTLKRTVLCAVRPSGSVKKCENFKRTKNYWTIACFLLCPHFRELQATRSPAHSNQSRQLKCETTRIRRKKMRLKARFWTLRRWSNAVSSVSPEQYSHFHSTRLDSIHSTQLEFRMDFWDNSQNSTHKHTDQNTPKE